MRSLGADARLLTVVGGPARPQIEDEIASLGVSARWIGTANPTRICTTLLTDDGQTTELVEEAKPISGSELDAFVAAFREEAAKADVFVATGSAPKGVPDDIWATLVESFPGRAVLDVRGTSLVRALTKRPFLVKPNREELEQTLGRPLGNPDALIAGMREIQQLGAAWVVVSAGPNAVLVVGEDVAFRVQPPTVQALNPIGSGDSLAAGIAWSLARGEDVPTAVRWGVACGAYNATQLLPCRLDATAVSRLFDATTVVET
jgi:1-phosphofructokinase family hexose kinase